MPNRLIKKITAKLVGAATAETFDIYDDTAVHRDAVTQSLTITNEGYVLDGRVGKTLNDALTNASWSYELLTQVTQTYDAQHFIHYNGNIITPRIYTGDTAFLIIAWASATTGRTSMHLVVCTGGNATVKELAHSDDPSYPAVRLTGTNQDAYMVWSGQSTADIRVAVLHIK